MTDTSFVQNRNQIYKEFSALQADNQVHQAKYLVQLFQFQYKYNNIYQQYCKNLGINSVYIDKPDKIPYLPISAFKHFEVKTGIFNAEEVFVSSGTTGITKSFHHVRNINHYVETATNIWKQYFNPTTEYCFLALLPGYLDREGSSLISMVHHFIHASHYSESGFYLRNHDDLYIKLIHCKKNNIPTVLFGVPYALLDFIEHFEISFPELIIIETGGMKGKRAEMPKQKLHDIISKHFKVQKIYSEYGMTELLSQAYTQGADLFLPNVNMRVTTHQINDPLTIEKTGKSGILCIADTANIDSCAFIQTEDMGRVYADGSFDILGRLEQSDIRGCNLLIEEIDP